ncbi:MAG TPA: hypothetical protein VMH27_18630 [Puia sp.]|nr:hypothetical protein [Puia sp.]
MRRLCYILLLTCLAGSPFYLAAQCASRPADCPVAGADQYGTADDSTSRLGNPVLPREITMENNLRSWANRVLDRITASEHWKYAELSEDVSSGDRAEDGSVLAYPLRPPHWMEIHYQIVVNDDSLAAWLNWEETFGQRRLDATMAYSKGQVAPDAAVKADKEFEAERRRMTIHYREASLLIVEFDFNMDYVKIAGAPSASPAPPAISGTTTVWFNNPNPEFNSIDLFDRCHTNAILFSGAFTKTPDGEGYRPAWKSDKTATNLSTPKKFRSDQVQSIDCHLSGNAAAMRRLLADFAPRELNALIAQP